MDFLTPCPPWCAVVPSDHDFRPDVDGRRFVLHARREHVLTAVGPREIELSRFDAAEPDGTVVEGPVEVIIDGAADAPTTLQEAAAYFDAGRSLIATADTTGALTTG